MARVQEEMRRITHTASWNIKIADSAGILFTVINDASITIFDITTLFISRALPTFLSIIYQESKLELSGMSDRI